MAHHVQYDSFNYSSLLQEFKGCTPSAGLSPSIQARWSLGKQPNVGTIRTATTKALDFAGDGAGFYLYARGGPDRSTLVQVGIREDVDLGPLPAADEIKLNHAVTDMAKIDDHHVVASLGNTLDIWKRSDTPKAFVQMQVVRGCWKETTPMHLIVPRKEDSACLVATGEGIQCIQLDGQCQKLRSFPEKDVVTSVQWHRNERYVFSGTMDEGMLSFYDVRVSSPVSSHFVQNGLFDHAHVGNHTVLCSGMGGVIHVVDSRKLGGPPVHSVADPFLQVCTELSCSNEGDLLALGENGFTLWKVGGRAGLQFRGLMHAHGQSRGGFAEPPRGPRRAFTTDSTGNFQEWDIQRYTNEKMKAASVPEFSEPVRARMPVLKNEGGQAEERSATAPSSELASNEWDWDLDFICTNPATPVPHQESSAASTGGPPAPAEEMNALPMRELDDLIGFYLS